jgi:hypothetical protein
LTATLQRHGCDKWYQIWVIFLDNSLHGDVRSYLVALGGGGSGLGFGGVETTIDYERRWTTLGHGVVADREGQAAIDKE